MPGNPEKTVVILIHGIRTAARWQNRAAAKIEAETGARVIPLKYGYFDTLRFLCPFGVCRNGPVERLRKQIEGIRDQYPDHRVILFAHSFGTYALSRILMENPHFKFDRIILCGSIIPENYDWSRVGSQIRAEERREAIINDCGTRDVWPVLAKAVTWGYGASGTYGFGDFNVRDRFHPLTHSQFFEEKFIGKYWVSAVKGETPAFSPGDKKEVSSPAWFGIFNLPLRWLLPVAVVGAVALGIKFIGPWNPCNRGLELIGATCIDRTALSNTADLRANISTLLQDVQRTLDIKGGDLFPAMDNYNYDPTPANWTKVKDIAVRLLTHLDKSVGDIGQYNGLLVKTDVGVYFISSDAKILVKDSFYQAFNDVKSQFNSRISLLGEINAAGEAPAPEQVSKWKGRLEILHGNLTRLLEGLLELLPTA
jgi:pimeloyl-ACP methyl ester carboxylesterase